MIIDASDLILGRIASFAAKKAMLGENIIIVNSENAVVTGKKESVLARYKQRKELGSRPTKGPFMPKMPDRFVRRAVRGMLPYKKEKGREAYKRVMCHIGVPAEFSGKKHETVPGASISKAPSLRYTYVKTICESMKGKK